MIGKDSPPPELSINTTVNKYNKNILNSPFDKAARAVE